MMKYIGILLGLNVVAVAGYCLLAGTSEPKRVATFSGIGLLIAALLVAGDRWTSFKIAGLGEIKASVETAQAGADRVKAIQTEVESQRDSIAMIVRDANQARDDIQRIEKASKDAQQKSAQLERVVGDAEKAQADLKQLAAFNLLLTRMNNDDRAAFDELLTTAASGQTPFRELATSAVINVASNMGGFVFVQDWALYHFEPKTADLPHYAAFLTVSRPDIQVQALDALWAEDRFPKSERLAFVISVMKRTPSIRVLVATCRIVNAEAKINKNIIAWRDYVQWWDINHAKYEQAP